MGVYLMHATIRANKNTDYFDWQDGNGKYFDYMVDTVYCLVKDHPTDYSQCKPSGAIEWK
jgi:hypothetical protein